MVRFVMVQVWPLVSLGSGVGEVCAGIAVIGVSVRVAFWEVDWMSASLQLILVP